MARTTRKIRFAAVESYFLLNMVPNAVAITITILASTSVFRDTFEIEVQALPVVEPTTTILIQEFVAVERSMKRNNIISVVPLNLTTLNIEFAVTE